MEEGSKGNPNNATSQLQIKPSAASIRQQRDRKTKITTQRGPPKNQITFGGKGGPH